MYRRYTSPLGYQTGTDGIDTYGVNHNGFSLRDELEYQNARQSRENRLMQNFNSQGMAENYPQYTTNFWGNNPDNNYGFGTSNISSNIANMNNTITPVPQTASEAQLQSNNSMINEIGNNLSNIIRKTGIDKLGENIYNLGYDAGERLAYSQNNIQQSYENKSSLAKAQAEYQRLSPLPISDVNKHQYVSCVGAFDGPISAGATAVAGLYKEGKDLYRKWNNPKYGNNLQIIQDSFKDLKNNFIGVSKGLAVNSIDNCNSLLPSKARRR